MMLSSSNRNLSLSLIRASRRNVIIPSSRDVRSRRRRVKTAPVMQSIDLDNIDYRNEKEVQFKMNQLQEFTKNLRQQIRHTDELRKKDLIEEKEVIDKTAAKEDIDGDAALILDGLNGSTPASEERNLSDFLLATKPTDSLLHKRLIDRIENKELVLRCLYDESNQNFNPIVDALYNSTKRLTGIGARFILSHITSKFNRLNYSSILKMDEMIMEALGGDVSKFKPDIYEWLMTSYSRLRSSKEDSILVCANLRTLLERMDKTLETKKFVPSQYMLNACIFSAYKAKSWDNMEFFLKKFTREYLVQPNKQNYTTVVSFYMSVGQYAKAWQLFDSMKFLSLEHKPDTKTYNIMLELCQKERNYAKTLDLFQEMEDLNVKHDLRTYLNVAKSLALSSADSVVSEGKADSLRLMGWSYVHKIQQNPELLAELNDKNNNLLFMETMMALSAYDGDVSLSRAIYYKYTDAVFKRNFTNFKKYHKDSDSVDYKIIWKRSLSPVMLNWLLLSYSKFKRSHLPLLLGYDEGSSLRRSILSSVDYVGRNINSEDINVKLPMLPTMELHDYDLILNESRALWQFNLEYGGAIDLRQFPEGLKTVKEVEDIVRSCKNLIDFKLEIGSRIMYWKENYVNNNILNINSLITYLTIAIRLSEPTEFKLRLNEFTFQSFEFEERVEQEFKKLKNLELGVVDPSQETNQVTKRPVSTDFIMYITSMKHKLATTCAIYEISMKAAIKFHDYDLAMKTWKDRGKFRMSGGFQKLRSVERQESDARFAQLMVEYFTEEKMYQDALSIIFSSLKTVKWSYPMIKSLHKGLLAIEDENSASRLLSVVNKKSKLMELDEEIKSLQI